MEAILGKLNPNKSTGVDKITPRFIRVAAPVISWSISKLINYSISSGTFPDHWKVARVTPLFKGGGASDRSSYRPISILPILSKVIERHIHNALYRYLTEYSLIYSKQSGFRKNHSTETALIDLVDTLQMNLDNKISSLLLVDYRKALDMIDHGLLRIKLEAYGVTGDSLKWFQSCLENRKQLVSLEGFESTEMTIRHGVPQGSILGPLLFVIFINDMPLHIDSEAETELYADDTTIMASADVNCIVGLEESLNMWAENIESWAIMNKLPLNEEKTKVLTITGKRLVKKITRLPNVKINGKLLDNVNCASLLGLNLEEKLTFEAHVEKLCKKMSQRIAVLKKIRHCLPLRQRKLYYNSIIRPVVDYVSVLWTSCNKECLRRVLKLQKRAARVILSVNSRSSSVKLFNQLGWIPFYEEVNISKCLYIFKQLNGILPSYMNDIFVINSQRHSRDTRYCNFNVVCPKYNRETEGGKTFRVTSCKLWNILPVSIRKEKSIKALKRNLWKKIFNEQCSTGHFSSL